ncbi:MAG: hypothetical protein WKF66_14895 [Pedobacter sp.]
MIIFKKIIPAVIIIGLFSACASDENKATAAKDSSIVSTSDSVSSDKALLLVPGTSAGKVSIDQNAEEVYAELGKPDAGDAAMQKAVAIWYKDHDPKSYATAIYTVRDTGDNPAARVRQIRVTSPAFKTADAVGVSSSLQEIQKAYTVAKLTDITDSGAPLVMYDSKSGIAFETDDNGICKAIIIHKAGESLKVTSLPLR